MTQTISAPATADLTVEPRPSTRTLLLAGSIAGPLFLVIGMIAGVSRAGFSFTRNAISQLSLGDLGWIQVTSFLLTGTLIIVGASGLRRALAGTVGGHWVPRLVQVFGASFLLAAVFKADAGAGFPVGTPVAASASSISWHGAVHMLSGMVGYLALCAAFFVLARHFKAGGKRGWVVACRLVPVAVLSGFAASGTAVLLFTAGAGLGLLSLTTVTAHLARKN